MSNPTSETSVIAADAFIKGELHLTGPGLIAGRIEGGVIGQDALEISAGGVVEGDIQGVLIDIQGTVKGNVIASQACRLGATARVAGELRAANLAIAEGACFVGQVYVGGPVTPHDEAAQHDSPSVQADEHSAAPINRISGLAEQAEALAETAAGATEFQGGVRVVSQTVQQTLQRPVRIIKAR